jgi:uncharacterized membrane protein
MGPFRTSWVRRRSMIVGVFAAAFAAEATQAQGTIVDIGPVDLNALSADGTTVVGRHWVNGNNRAFRWTVAGGIQDLGLLPGYGDSHARGVSGDGAVVAGWSGSRAFRWTVASGMEELVTAGGDAARGRGISGDGLVVIGDSRTPGGQYYACRWLGAAGIEVLGTLPGADGSLGLATNNDGSVVLGETFGGTAADRSFLWSAGGGMEDIGPRGIVALSADGRAAAGTAWALSRAVRWTAAGGMQDLGLLPGASFSRGLTISADGLVVGGSSSPAGGTWTAFLWTAQTGMIDAKVHLASRGVNVDGWTLNNVFGLSADGLAMAGFGTFNGGQQRAWYARIDPDTDGDGLLDDWEINGIPYVDIHSMPQRFMLPGADPMRKDLYVEIDAMAGLAFDASSKELVIEAFRNAPVTNPDNSTGITLHILRDDTDLPHVPVWATIGCWPADFQAVRDTHYGTAAERADPSVAELLAAKAKAYRYCIKADRSGPNSFGGCGQTPGDNFVIFTAGYPIINEAAVFMHELGHNLGLRHGGCDGINGKANYPSIMNYTLLYRKDWNKAFWRLDFSRAGNTELADLDETSLNELAGIGTPAGEYQGYHMPFGVNFDTGTAIARQIRYVRLNGTAVDFGSPGGTGFQDGLFSPSIPQDLNYVVDPPAGVTIPSAPSPGQTLLAWDDWANISLPLAATLGPSAPAPSYPDDELTVEGAAWIEQNFPVPPGACYANCDRSTVAPVLNVDDFTCFINSYATGTALPHVQQILHYANCDESTIAPVLNVDDFTCFINQYAAGCP